MRIAIAGIIHETNTYVRDQTQLDDFQVLRGEQLLRLSGTKTQTGSAIDTCTRRGSTPVPLFWAFAQPSGIIAASVYSALKSELLERLAAAMPVDGVFLDLHGAGTADGTPDLEADLVGEVRRLVGPNTPVTAAFDLHGNVTQRMADGLDGVFACHEYPHTDLHERAAEAVTLLHDMLAEDFRPTVLVETVPILMPTTTTFHGIGAALRDRMRAAERAGTDVIAASLFHGFPYADVPQVGCHIVITARAEPDRCRALAKQLGRALWAERDALRAHSLSAEEAVQAALAAQARPVVINETSDNCGGGAPGDGTHLLRAMLEQGLDNACFGFIVDAEVAAQAHAAGVGSTLTVSLGGKTDDLHGAPLTLSVYVKALHDGRCVMQAMTQGSRINYGSMARLQVRQPGPDQQLNAPMDIVVASRRSQTFDTEPFLAVGIDVRSKDYIALKSSNHFRAGFEHLAGTIVTADPPGLMTHHIEVFERRAQTGPLWPIDPDVTYD